MSKVLLPTMWGDIYEVDTEDEGKNRFIPTEESEPETTKEEDDGG